MMIIRWGAPVRRRGLRGLQVFGSLVALLYASWGHAATIVVSPTCSLIDSIHAANTDAPAGGCAAGSGADTIVIPPSTHVILTEIDNMDLYDIFGPVPAGLPVIESSITIAGNGSTLARDPSADEFTIFAVRWDGNLTLERTTVTGATTAVNNYYGVVTLDRTTLSDNGYGIASQTGNTSLIESTVSGNTVGIMSRFASIDLDRTAVVRNGAGIYSSGFIDATNSTISHNRGHGFTQVEGAAWLTHCTLSGNLGYGIDNTGLYMVELSHSIVSGNHLGEANGYSAHSLTSFIVDDYNIFGHDGVSGTNFPLGTTDIVPEVPLSSILEPPLRRNGGRTPNHALVAGSPAINAVPFGEYCPPTDQRNVTRRKGAICDIGAYELIE